MTVRSLSVIGLGKLGLPLAAALASRGFDVVGVDADAARIAALRAHSVPLVEPGVREALEAHRARLRWSTEVDEAVAGTDATFILVPTPSEPDGRFSLTAVSSVAGEIGRALKGRTGYHLVNLVSTVMPEATRSLEALLVAASGKRCGRDFGLCYNPEFIALGSVLSDLLRPSFVLIGESDPQAGALLADVYRRLAPSAPVSRMSYESAEIAKLSLNSFVTAKISYANLIERLCHRTPGADVDAVTSAVGLDPRIGKEFFRGGLPYGGPCFPRDNLALGTFAESRGVPAELPRATDRFNRTLGPWLRELSREARKGATYAVLGVSYKPGTEVLDEAPGLQLVARLLETNEKVLVFDPLVKQLPVALSAARVVAGLDRCLDEADVIYLMQDSAPFRGIRLSDLAAGRAKLVIDCWRLLRDQPPVEGITYVPVGWSR